MANVNHVASLEPKDPLMKMKEKRIKIKTNLPVQTLTVSENFGKIVKTLKINDN